MTSRTSFQRRIRRCTSVSVRDEKTNGTKEREGLRLLLPGKSDIFHKIKIIERCTKGFVIDSISSDKPSILCKFFRCKASHQIEKILFHTIFIKTCVLCCKR